MVIGQIFIFICLTLFITFKPSMAQTDQSSQLISTSPDEFKVCQNCFSQFSEQEQMSFNIQNQEATPNTRSILIIKSDVIVYERYSHETSITKAHRLWSMSKSIASLLIGRRIFEDKMALKDPLSKYYPHLSYDREKASISLENLLTMTSGIDWKEIYEENPFASDVIKMLYLGQNKDMPKYVLSKNQKYPPGYHFYYSSGETNLLMGALKESFPSLEEYKKYPWQSLFTPLGITSAQWETDEANTFVGSSYLYMSARDLAKIALFILHDGILPLNPNSNDTKETTPTRLISSEYLAQSFRPVSASCTTQTDPSSPPYSYGLSWWLNAPCKEREESQKKAFSQLPDNLILALGHHGQTLAIFPSEQALAIRFGADKDKKFDREKWLEAVYKGLKKTSLERETL